MVISVVTNNSTAMAMAVATASTSSATTSVRPFCSLRPPLPLSKAFPPFGSSSFSSPLTAGWGARERREKRWGGVLSLIQCKAKSVDESGFEKEVLQSELPVLVEFWAEWCGPCKLVGPIIDSIAQEYQGTLKAYKIETDSNPNLVEQYRVYGLPTLILFKDGKEVPGSHKEGAINKKKLKALLDELLGSVPTT